MSHLGLGRQAWGWGTEPSRRSGRGLPFARPARTCARHHPPQPLRAPASQQRPVPLQGPSQARNSRPLLPQGAFRSPLSALSCIPHWGATAANRGTDLPKVTRAGRAPSRLNGGVQAPSQLDAFGSRPLRGCLHDPGPACQVQGDGRWLGFDLGAGASLAPGGELSDNPARHTGRGGGGGGTRGPLPPRPPSPPPPPPLNKGNDSG